MMCKTDFPLNQKGSSQYLISIIVNGFYLTHIMLKPHLKAQTAWKMSTDAWTSSVILSLNDHKKKNLIRNLCPCNESTLVLIK